LDKEVALDLVKFHSRVKEYLRFSSRLQKELAREMSLHPNVLTHKFKGSSNYTLTASNIKEMILILADWESFTFQQQVIELLAFAGLDENSFSSEQWQTPPLSKLKKNPSSPASYKPLTPSPIPPASASAKTDQTEPSSFYLPAQLTSLVGREELIQKLSNQLKQTGVRLLTLTGVGGVGKTRLGLAVAAESQSAFQDGIYFVSVAQIQDPSLIPGQIAQAVGVGIKPGLNTDLLAQLKSFLHPKLALLVLDNFEQVLRAAPILAELLTAAPGLKILVTSRSLLQIYGEFGVIIPPLKLPSPGESFAQTAPGQSEAVRLFCERASAADPNFELSVANGQTIVNICIFLEGLPLAIELAAAWCFLLSPAAIYERLTAGFASPTGHFYNASTSGRLGLLSSKTIGLPERHQTLRSTLDWSFNLLDQLEKTLLCRLGVFRGPFSGEAAEAICFDNFDNNNKVLRSEKESSLKIKDVSTLLDSLVKQSLLQRKPSIAESSNLQVDFELLETVREYLLEKLQSSQEFATLQERHALYYIQLIRIAEPYLKKTDQSWLKLLSNYQANIRAALIWCGESSTRTILQLEMVGRFWRYWMLKGWLAEGLQQVEVVLEKAAAEGTLTSTLEYARVLAAGGALASFLGDLDLSQQYSTQSLELMKELDNQSGIASCLNNLALIAWQQRDYIRYEQLLLESLNILQQIDDLPALGICLNNLGVVTDLRGEYNQARSYFLESLLLRQELGDKIGVGVTLNNLGLLAQHQGDFDQARKLYGQSLALKQEVDDKLGICAILNNIGVLFLLEEKLDLAEESFVESLAVSQALGYKSKQMLSLTHLGLIAYKRYEETKSREYFLQSFIMAVEVQDPHTVAVALIGLAALRARNNQDQKAIRLCALVEGISQANPFPNEMYKAHLILYNNLLQTLKIKLGIASFNQIWADIKPIPLKNLPELVAKLRLLETFPSFVDS